MTNTTLSDVDTLLCCPNSPCAKNGAQALEALQKLKKDKLQETKEMRLKLETLKSHKDAAQTLQQQLHNGNAQALDMEASIAVLQVCHN
jgi:hypothetical protein